MQSQTILPLFPLQAVVFPGELFPLHIFEERYKVMIQACLDAGPHGLFGVHLANAKQLASVGCAVAIAQVSKRYDDGRMDIVTVGRRRYRGGKVLRDSQYLKIEAEFFDDFIEPVDLTLRGRAVALHCRLLELAGKRFSVPVFGDGQSGSYVLAHAAGLEPEEKQRLVELTSENLRLQELVNYYERAIPKALEDHALRARIQLNGHFRKLGGEDV